MVASYRRTRMSDKNARFVHANLVNHGKRANNGIRKSKRPLVLRETIHPHTVEVTGSNPVSPNSSTSLLIGLAVSPNSSTSLLTGLAVSPNSSTSLLIELAVSLNSSTSLLIELAVSPNSSTSLLTGLAVSPNDLGHHCGKSCMEYSMIDNDLCPIPRQTDLARHGEAAVHCECICPMVWQHLSY